MAFVVSNNVSLVDLFSDSVKFDGGDELLGRYLDGFQERVDSWVQRFVDLHKMRDAFELEIIRADSGKTTLDFALWIVGLTDELNYIVERLTNGQKRALLRAVAALWKMKGVPVGWLRWVALLTANPGWYGDYNHWRYITEEDGVADGPVLLDPLDDPVFGAYQSDLYVLNPNDAEMRTLIRDIVDITRPGNERVRIRWVSALEIWDRDFSGWNRSGDVDMVEAWKADDAGLRGPGYAEVQQPDGEIIYHLLPAGSAHYTLQLQLRSAIDENGNCAPDIIFHRMDASNFYYFRVDMVAQFSEFHSVVGGVDVLVASAPFPVPLETDPDLEIEYRIEISSSRSINNTTAVLRVDGETFLEATVLGFLSGDFGVRTASGDVEVGLVMAFFPPVLYSIAAPPSAFDDEV